MDVQTRPTTVRADLQRSLQDLAHLVHDQLGATDGAGVTVLLGTGSVSAGANSFTDALDDAQQQATEGPCLSALTTGRIVRSKTISTTERRWPRFTAMASSLALGSVLSVPVLAGDELVGSLNLYSHSPEGLVDTGRAELRRVSATVLGPLVATRLVALVEEEADDLAAALLDRTHTDLAVGLLMDRYSLRDTEAAILLAQLARHDGVSTPQAARILTGQTG